MTSKNPGPGEPDFSGDLRTVRPDHMQSDKAINDVFLAKMKVLFIMSKMVSGDIMATQKRIGEAAEQAGQLTPEDRDYLEHLEISMANLMLHVAAAHANIKMISHRDYETPEEAGLIIRQINAYHVDLKELVSLEAPQA